MSFDLKTDHKDPKTGKTVQQNHYIMHISQQHGTIFERDGAFFWPDSTEIGYDPRKGKPAETVEVKSTVVEVKPEPKVEVKKGELLAALTKK